MQRVRRFVLAPVMVIWLISQRTSAQSIPRPTDAPHAHAAGFNSDRVLIFGCGPAVGVVSHEIALPGSLARALSARTGRGTDVDVVADMRINAGSARNWLRRIAVRRYDTIIVMLGANDALPLTPLLRWRTRLSSVLAHLRESTSPDARIFVAGVPPIQSVPGFESRLGVIAGNFDIKHAPPNRHSRRKKPGDGATREKLKTNVKDLTPKIARLAGEGAKGAERNERRRLSSVSAILNRECCRSARRADERCSDARAAGLPWDRDATRSRDRPRLSPSGVNRWFRHNCAGRRQSCR